MGFEKQINCILQLLPKQRRTGLFSATQSTNVQQLIRVGMRNPIRIELKISHKSMKTQSTPKSLKNQYIKIKEGEKGTIVTWLSSHPTMLNGRGSLTIIKDGKRVTIKGKVLGTESIVIPGPAEVKLTCEHYGNAYTTEVLTVETKPIEKHR